MYGDKNSKYYHQTIRRRRGRNQIRKIFWENRWISTAAQLKDAFFNHFSCFFGKEKSFTLLKLKNLVLKKLSAADSERLDKEIGLEELEFALNKLPCDKAPGPDGLNVGFIKII